MKTLREEEACLTHCARCGTVDARFTENVSAVSFTSVKGEPVKFEPKDFCSWVCQDRYYYDDIKAEQETKYLPRLNAFYENRLAACDTIRKELFHKWLLLREATTNDLVDDIRAFIMYTVLGLHARTYTRLVRPSLLDREIGAFGASFSVIKAGRGLLYIQGDDRNIARIRVLDSYNPLYIEDLCSVFIVKGRLFLFFYSGHIYVTHKNSGVEGNPLFQPIKGVESGVIQVAHSKNTILALKMDGSIWAWGDLYVPNGSSYGQLPRYTNTEFRLLPFGNDNLSASVAADYILVIKSDGTLWTMGVNRWTEHRLYSYNEYVTHSTPENMSLCTLDQIPLGEHRVRYVRCHDRRLHSLVMHDNEIWCMDIETRYPSMTIRKRTVFDQNETESILAYESRSVQKAVVSNAGHFCMGSNGLVSYEGQNTYKEFGRVDSIVTMWRKAEFLVPLVDNHRHVQKKFRAFTDEI